MKKILIANRGEIAVRIINSLKKMNIGSVAVYSEADVDAPHAVMADEAIYIGSPPSSESYLLGDKIISIALEHGCDGIHPGYGFLSENADFSEAVKKAGLTFIGPDPHAIRVMGSKLAAKEAVSKFDIPMVPGTDGAISDLSEAKSIAEEIGLPVLVKASAGGGGKGMRLVEDIEDIEEQIKTAMSEAKSAFGDGSVFIEKFVTSPRHIEFQVFADRHGNCVHLFERECSIQRRHQKVVEEAPSALLDSNLRKRMGDAAIDVARACDYVGAGTVEFLVDDQNNFYFLEMNTRLQVEHPVTEIICGVDLVEWQVKIASGEPLPMRQEDLKMNGHALELRVYAEDVENNFAPSIGRLDKYHLELEEGIRLDDGYRQGMEVPIYYDPMLSKLIVHAENRKAAIDLMRRAIDNFTIEGIESTLPFGQFVMNHRAFVSGEFTTKFVDEYWSKREDLTSAQQDAVIHAAAHFFHEATKNLRPIKHTES